MTTSPAATVPRQSEPSLIRGLTLTDAVLLLVGGVIGSAIFLTAGQVATELRTPGLFILVWVAGAVISMLAGFAVAELGGMFPDAGGQYVFLREAYGELPAFLYGWMIFAVVQTGTIAALAVGFAQYFDAAFPGAASANPIYSLTIPGGKWMWNLTMRKLVSVAAIGLLTLINIVGLKRGSLLVNVSTWLKFAAMAAMIIFGMIFGKGDWGHFNATQTSAGAGGNSSLLSAFGVALISVFFAFDGWVYVTWVAGEIKDAARNVPRSLMIGLACVAVVYIAMNVVYVYALPMADIIKSEAVVQEAATTMFNPRMGRWLSIVVALSCFGAMSSAILCTARIFFAMAKDGIFFQRMAQIHPRFRTPAFSLIAQGAWAAALALIGLYDQLLTYSIFMMILAYVASVGALFVLRRRMPGHPRPYRCTGYPVVPALYLLIATAWTLNTIWQRPWESLGGLAIVLLGIPGFVYWTRQRRLDAAV